MVKSSMSLVPLQASDSIEIVAPASRCDMDLLSHIKDQFCAWGLNCHYPETIMDYRADLLCAQTDDIRLAHLYHALTNPATQAIWCLLGGYGSMHLIPKLMTMAPPAKMKLFMGFSDITALHLFFNQHWNWPTLHAPCARQLPLQTINQTSIQALKSLLLDGLNADITDLTPLNTAANTSCSVTAKIIGGNLSIVQCSIGTPWQMDATDKIILLEDTGERAYQIDRMLVHLQQAGVFHQAKAVLFGSFNKVKDANESEQVQRILQCFATALPIPVVQTQHIGHAEYNMPVWLNKSVDLTWTPNDNRRV